MFTALGICAILAGLPVTTDVRSLVNEIRRGHGLPPVRLNAALQNAAEAHVSYMRANRSFGHTEERGNKGFCGRTPGDRARAFGYRGANGEALSESSLGVDDALNGLFAAPYHRAMFLQPLSPDFGAAAAGGAVCIKLGGPTGDGTVLSPPNRAIGVPTLWDGTETPDPLRTQNADGPFGYPVVVAFFGADSDRLRLVRAQMSDARGREVELFTVHPGNDRLAGSMFALIPKRPLAKSGAYSVRIEYANAAGKHVIASSFKTAN